MLLPTRRRKLVITVALCSSILVLCAYYEHLFFPQTPTTVDTETNAATDTTATSLPATTFCDSSSCLKGAWIPREKPFTTIEEVKPWTGCPSPLPSGVRRTAAQNKADAKRLLDVMNWVWKPDNGIMKGWDPVAFVARLLKSPGGLIIVGDEMSDQYFSSVVVLLRRDGIIMDLQMSEYPYVHSYVIQSNDIAKGLLSKAGVPASRLLRPVLTLIEDSFLISVKDLRGIAKRVGAIPGYDTWSSPFPQANGWTDYVKAVSGLLQEEQAFYPEDTVLLLNTGNTWSREYLTLLRPRNRPVDEKIRLTEAYRQMVRNLSNRLKNIAHLSVFYRATTPGHPNCASRSSPYQNSETAETKEGNVVGRLTKIVTSESERELKQKWDWDLFNTHNDVWRRATVRLERERMTPGPLWSAPKKKMAKWHYLDVWNQTLQRPDAHYEPPHDCLNWCPPAIFDQWTLHIHHNLQMLMDKTKQSNDTDTY